MKKLMPVIALICVAVFYIAGCAQPVVTQTPSGPVTNYVANSYANTASQGAQIAAPFVPQPWGTIIGALGILVAAGASGIAAYKNAKLNAHASMLNSVIAGVETAGTPATKTAIQNIASAAGVSAQLDAIVQTVTGTMVPKTP